LPHQYSLLALLRQSKETVNKTTQDLSFNIFFLYEIDHAVRKFVLTEIEKLCNTYFSGTLSLEELRQLLDVAVSLHLKFGEDIYSMLTQVLTDEQKNLISREFVGKMVPQKGVGITIDDLILGWVTVFYQNCHGRVKSSMEGDNWEKYEFEEGLVDTFDYLMFGPNKPPELDGFIALNKKLVIGEERFHVTKSFVCLVELVRVFLQLSRDRLLGISHLLTKMAELVMVLSINESTT
jgi:hypothetical protein